MVPESGHCLKHSSWGLNSCKHTGITLNGVWLVSFECISFFILFAPQGKERKQAHETFPHAHPRSPTHTLWGWARAGDHRALRHAGDGAHSHAREPFVPAEAEEMKGTMDWWVTLPGPFLCVLHLFSRFLKISLFWDYNIIYAFLFHPSNSLM